MRSHGLGARGYICNKGLALFALAIGLPFLVGGMSLDGAFRKNFWEDFNCISGSISSGSSVRISNEFRKDFRLNFEKDFG